MGVIRELLEENKKLKEDNARLRETTEYYSKQFSMYRQNEQECREAIEEAMGIKFDPRQTVLDWLKDGLPFLVKCAADDSLGNELEKAYDEREILLERCADAIATLLGVDSSDEIIIQISTLEEKAENETKEAGREPFSTLGPPEEDFEFPFDGMSTHEGSD